MTWHYGSTPFVLVHFRTYFLRCSRLMQFNFGLGLSVDEMRPFSVRYLYYCGISLTLYSGATGAVVRLWVA